MSNTKVSSKGQIVIPVEIRKRYGLRRGIKVEWVPLSQTEIIVRKPVSRKKMSWSEWAGSWRGLGKEIWEGIDPVKYTHELWDGKPWKKSDPS